MTILLKAIGCCVMFAAAGGQDGAAGGRTRVQIESSVDGTMQPSDVLLPAGFDPEGAPVPLLVSLHTWSGDLSQRRVELELLAGERGWVCLFPNFRGPNDSPHACGSERAQQDVLDAVAWVRARYPIDADRIYLTGVSGGGHMTMLMVGRHPELWAAASAWVGISDLAAWHRRHAGQRYGAMMEKCCGGAPGDSDAVDEEYRERSPLTHLHRAIAVPLDIAAGVHDGLQGSVPVRHSLDAFNLIATAAGVASITEEEIGQISRPDGRLERPRPGDQVEDAFFGRKIHLRREAAEARVTIFEGGHEGLDRAAIEWLARHRRGEGG